jgi:acyl carrier protein
MSAYSQLKAAFSEAINVPSNTDFESLTYRGIKQWDSVAHMQLIRVLERQFDIMLPTDDVLDLSSFTKAVEILSKHGVNFE